MPYRELIFFVDALSAEPLSDALLELGALSVSVTDAQANTPQENPLYGEPGFLPEVEAWHESQVQALFDRSVWDKYAQHTEAILAELSLAGLAVEAYTEQDIEDQDWVQLTQSQFDPIRISERLWIIPSWHQTPKEAHKDSICLAVDPGLAFGTGSHPTTKLCLEWLESIYNAGLIQHHTVLDYGCGSGILAIAAKKFGAGLVCGIDVDPQAIISGKQNALQNNVSIQFGLPDSLTSDSHFQIVVANILTNPLQVLAPAICSHLAPDGRLALCGILERQAKQVIDTYAPWVLLTVKESLDGWVFLTSSPIVSSK